MKAQGQPPLDYWDIEEKLNTIIIDEWGASYLDEFQAALWNTEDANEIPRKFKSHFCICLCVEIWQTLEDSEEKSGLPSSLPSFFALPQKLQSPLAANGSAGQCV